MEVYGSFAINVNEVRTLQVVYYREEVEDLDSGNSPVIFFFFFFC